MLFLRLFDGVNGLCDVTGGGCLEGVIGLDVRPRRKLAGLDIKAMDWLVALLQKSSSFVPMTSFLVVEDADDDVILEISVVSVASIPTSRDSASESTRSVPFCGRSTTTTAVVAVVEDPKLWTLLLLFFLLDNTSSSSILDGVDDLEVGTLDEVSDVVADVTDIESSEDGCSCSITDGIGMR